MLISLNSRLVSMPILGYNQEAYIEEAVKSAFGQDYSPLEIILSDDGSTDGTYAIMEKMAKEYKGKHRVILNKNSENLGIAGHINRVLELSNGTFISWAAGDDISFENKISSLVNPMLSNNEIVGVHSAVIEISDSNEKKKRSNKNKEKINSLTYILKNGAGLGSQSHAFRKSVFDFFGPLSLDVTHEAKVMSFRESALGKIKYIDNPLIYYRIDSGISNYKGRDINKVTLSEPLKIAGWYFFSTKQIAEDAKKITLDGDIERLLEKKLLERKLLYEINFYSWNWSALYNYIIYCSKKNVAIWAFIRRNSSKFMRKIYLKLFKK
jgi:glycosyltransferase involved in cell wall biosynthesis